MKHLTILVPNAENNESNIAENYKIINRANAYHAKTAKRKYIVELADTASEVDLYNGLFTARPLLSQSVSDRTGPKRR